jgi:hypothetical protein
VWGGEIWRQLKVELSSSAVNLFMTGPGEAKIVWVGGGEGVGEGEDIGYPRVGGGGGRRKDYQLVGVWVQ